MPDPKKKKSTGRKAQATGARPTGREKNVSSGGKGVSRTEQLGVGERVSSTGSAGDTYGKTKHYAGDYETTGRMYRNGEFIPLVSGGHGGRVSSASTRDPFLEGLNSDLDGIRERPAGRRRRK